MSEQPVEAFRKALKRTIGDEALTTSDGASIASDPQRLHAIQAAARSQVGNPAPTPAAAAGPASDQRAFKVPDRPVRPRSGPGPRQPASAPPHQPSTQDQRLPEQLGEEEWAGEGGAERLGGIPFRAAAEEEWSDGEIIHQLPDSRPGGTAQGNPPG